LHTQKLRVGTNDLAIAAITLAARGILVTRNTVDFQRIPGLVLEDWTRP
jgi:tRNA(fMet)-specific endonuclease VapC